MKRKPYLVLSLSAGIGLLIVFVLYIASETNRNHRYASFERNFKKSSLQQVGSLNLGHPSYYFSGNTGHTIYLANRSIPTHLLSVNANLTDTTHHNIMVVKDSLRYRSINVAVDSPFFYISDGTQPFVYRGDVKGQIASPFVEDVFFKTVLPISDKSLVFVSVAENKTRMETVLSKLTDSNRLTHFHEILEEQGDGIFSTDGMLLWDKMSSRLIYVYYYRNQYICMDTSLSVSHRSNTIDTISQAKISTGQIATENSFTMASPPLVTNKRSAICTDYLFINSNLLARNENVRQFEEQSVIDVYDVIKGDYIFSCYIPQYEGKRASKFIALDCSTIVALHDRHLVAYKLHGTQSDLTRNLLRN